MHAGLLPAGKSALVDGLRRERSPVAMVSDGINDAPALAAADIGIAVAASTGATMAAADITVVHGGVGAVADAVMLAAPPAGASAKTKGLGAAAAVPAPDRLVHRQRWQLACARAAGPVSPAGDVSTVPAAGKVTG